MKNKYKATLVAMLLVLFSFSLISTVYAHAIYEGDSSGRIKFKPPGVNIDNALDEININIKKLLKVDISNSGFFKKDRLV